MNSTPAVDEELWLGPPWLIVIVALTLFTVVMWSLEWLYPGAGIGLRWAPLLSAGAVGNYTLLIRVVSGDPRLWRDPARLARLVGRRYPEWSRRHAGDPALADRLRDAAWRSGATAIAQQVGAMAGIGAGYAALDQGAVVTLALIAVVGGIVGIATWRWLSYGERAN